MNRNEVNAALFACRMRLSSTLILTFPLSISRTNSPGASASHGCGSSICAVERIGQINPYRIDSKNICFRKQDEKKSLFQQVCQLMALLQVQFDLSHCFPDESKEFRKRRTSMVRTFLWIDLGEPDELLDPTDVNCVNRVR